MTHHNQQQGNDDLLIPLAVALVSRPRASLQELAKAIGISKATLYRYCRTRNQMIQRLMAHGIRLWQETVRNTDMDKGPPQEVLQRLIAHSLANNELYAFMKYYWNNAAIDRDFAVGWESTLDAFFLRGQREGVFRIDISAQALTEIYVTLTGGMIDAERRGRVARVGLAALIENAFLNGVRAT